MLEYRKDCPETATASQVILNSVMFWQVAMARFIFPHRRKSDNSHPVSKTGWLAGLSSSSPLNMRLFFLAICVVSIAYISWQAWPSFFQPG